MSATARPQDPATEGTADRIADAAEAVRIAVEGRFPAALHADGGVKVHLTNAPGDPEAGLATEGTAQSIEERIGALSTPAAGTVNARLEALAQSVADVEAATVALGTSPLARQDTLEAVNGKLPALSSGRVPVELDSAALTALESITVSGAIQATQSGSWSVDTELPAAVTLADNLSLPSAPIVGAGNLVYDGTNLDLVRSVAALPSAGVGLAATALAVNESGAYNAVKGAGDALLGGVLGAAPELWGGASFNAMRSHGGITEGSAFPAGTPAASLWATGASGFARRVLTVGGMGDGTGDGLIAVGNTTFNGSTFDRQRGNVTSTLLASTPRTATATSATQTNHNGRGVMLFLNVTATPNNAETLTVSVAMVDPVTGATRTLSAFTAIIASSLGATPAAGAREFVFVLYPGVAETAAIGNHEVQAGLLPRSYVVVVTHSASSSWTYSLGQSLNV